MTPQEFQKLLEELEASRASRRRARENLQEIRWVLKHSARRWRYRNRPEKRSIWKAAWSKTACAKHFREILKLV
jgi:hypothetical protein